MSDTGWPESPEDRAERKRKLAHESNNRTESASYGDPYELAAQDRWLERVYFVEDDIMRIMGEE